MIVGLCHGCFDILHFGHVRHFKAAKAMCDELVVSITADAFVNKGPDRPVFTLEQRMEVVGGIVHVSRVVASHFPTGLQSLQAVKPQLYFKDAEYKNSTHPGFLEEQAYCLANGIKMVFTEELRSSSSAALARLKQATNV